MNKEIINILTKEFKIYKLFLFGNSSKQSDIDILIVSNDFKNISQMKRKMLIKKNSSKLDPICLTYKELQNLKNSNSSLWKKISTEGQRLL